MIYEVCWWFSQGYMWGAVQRFNNEIIATSAGGVQPHMYLQTFETHPLAFLFGSIFPPLFINSVRDWTKTQAALQVGGVP